MFDHFELRPIRYPPVPALDLSTHPPEEVAKRLSKAPSVPVGDAGWELVPVVNAASLEAGKGLYLDAENHSLKIVVVVVVALGLGGDALAVELVGRDAGRVDGDQHQLRVVLGADLVIGGRRESGSDRRPRP